MIIKICGVNDPENLRHVARLDADWIGLNFYPLSPRCLNLRGLPPAGSSEPQRVGVFVDEMPQTILSRIVAFHLGIVQLHGSERAVMIQNLRRSLVPDIREKLVVIKAINVATVADFSQCGEYEGVVDYFLFDTKGALHGGNGEKFNWDLLDAYQGHTPFLLSGGIGPGDANALRGIRHPLFRGVDVNSKFETAPGVKDINLLRSFIKRLRE